MAVATAPVRMPARNGRTPMVRFVASLVACVAFGVGLSPNPASGYPTRPVTLVLGFAPGGPSDVMARVFSRKLEQVLGQPVVIDNRAGAGGNIAAESVARAAPDGYTILLANSGILAANAQLYKRPGFNAEKDFAPITRIGAQANVLVVNPAVPATTLAELVAHAKANPGKVSYASGGHGSSPHLAAELLKAEAKINLVHVPYKGTGPALRDVVAGHVQMMFSAVSPSKPLMESGKVRGLAVTTLKRTALLPDVPSVAEAAIPGFEATAWHALVAPMKTPPAALATLHKAMMATLKDPEINLALTKLGLDVMPTTPEELAAYIGTEIPKWAKIIQASGATLQ
ncbi:MAG: tripartite tricarboxylate transporter substrate binding protein [Rhizobiales bacterium]|nr:tripartite tricarboxylate transporter substrate binding protein [Hyphomicrobiales bacterium]